MKNPYLNAVIAGAYIVGGVYLGNAASAMFKAIEGTLFVPMIMLSLFVLSAAIMGFLFVGQPFQLYLDGHKQKAITFFFKTLATFALFILVLLTFMLYR